ncbi:minor tail protein [Gordonia phage Catfish]|uniref:Minor tail protein n=1 Tax=Gordonia phage Catfish TaxID=2301538 RepID=A0A385D1G5_9CAUD|nr:minor tail protein [Gordonia phage Catfish]AXQ51864.1 minor tail protein [Gordonia phage Catfish]
MATLIRFRRNTATEAAEANPVLEQGEPGFAFDTNTLKIGDGVRAWNDLPDVGEDVAGLVVYWDDLSQDVRDRVTARLTQAQADALYATVGRVAAVEDRATALETAIGGKVDKITGTNRVHTNDGSGNPSSVAYSSAATPQTMMFRTAGGVTSVAAGTDPAHAVNKGQMDTALGAKANASALTTKADLVNGVIPTSQLPRVSIGETYSVPSQAAMLALDVQPGDVAIRTDVDTVFMLKAAPASTVGNWFDLSSSAAGGVVSVNGQTGTVNLGKADLGLGNVDNTSDAAKPISTAVSNALAGKVGTSDARLTDRRAPLNQSVTSDSFESTLRTALEGAVSKAASALQGEVVATLPTSPVAGRVYVVTG